METKDVIEERENEIYELGYAHGFRHGFRRMRNTALFLVSGFLIGLLLGYRPWM